MFDAIANYISEVVRGRKIRVAGQDAQWRKVSELKVGVKILAAPLPKLPTEVAEASDKSQRDMLLENKTTSGAVFFDEIVSIKRLSPERVWDIEVEGTHNFVAGHLKNQGNSAGSGTFGGILAHNTYISGNLGIGTTAPAAKLDIVGSQNFTAFTAPAALTAGTPTAGGSCTAGTHSYAVTFTSVGSGETTAGTASNIITCVLTSGQTVPLSAIPTGPAGTISRKIYRTVAGNTGSYLLLTTIADNTTITFSDTVADASLGAAAPVSNTTAVANLQTGGTTRMVIDSSGNVGIGTTTPSQALYVNGNIAANVFYDTSSTAYYLDPGNGGNSLIVSGNIGAGTTSPQNKLDISGNAAFGSYAGSNTAPTNGIIVSGNVGIGTTSPNALLHVAGQCVAGDTLLRRRRKRRRKGQNGQWIDEWYWEEVRIDEIEEGDGIMTLDENTQEFVVSKVKALMNMGIKTTFSLTTSNGKTIRTTAEHPYLTRDLEDVDTNFFHDLTYQTLENLGRKYYETTLEGKEFGDILFSHEGFEHIVHEQKSKLNILSRILGLPKVMAVLENSTTFQKHDLKEVGKNKHDYWVYEQTIDGVKIQVVVRSVDGGHKHFYSVVWKGFDKKNVEGAVSGISHPPQRMVTLQRRVHDLIVTFIDEMSRSGVASPAILKKFFKVKWVKVRFLKPGTEIATVGTDDRLSWQKIEKIKKVGQEQVYDIEVENTHNFVGNGIVAHNTAIFGAGEGGTPTATTIRGAAASGTNIAGANLTFDASNGTGTGGSGALIFRTAPTGATGSTTNTLAEIMRITPGGNVGIGTTSPGYLVDIQTPSASQGYLALRKSGGNITVRLGDQSSAASNGSLELLSAGAQTVGLYAVGPSWINSGNVGIGTTGPGNKLGVTITTNDTIPALGSNGGSFGLFKSDAGATPGSYGFIMGVLSSGNVFQQAQRIDGAATAYNLLLQPTGGNVGIGTTGPEVSLDVNGDFKWQDFRYYKISRTLGSNTNDWVEVGSFANSGVSQFAEFDLKGHWCGSIISQHFRYDDIAYTGSSSNWIELPASFGGTVYNNNQPVAVDVKRTTPGSTSDPFLARVRNLQGMCGGTSLTIYIKTNTPYTSTSASGTSGSVDAGYMGSVAGWKFPVSTNANVASTNGLFINSAGNVGIGTTSPLAKLHVVGECVIGETLLPIKRRKKKKKSEKEEDEFDDLLIPIKDVEEGDFVASLDQTTGEIVYKSIRKLMNKGFQKVVKITTTNGRSIETTVNHPYLTISKGKSDFYKSREVWAEVNRDMKWVKVSQLKVGDTIAVPKARSKKITYVFIDASNLMYAASRVGWKMDYEKLASYLHHRFGADRLLFYGGVDNSNKKQLGFYHVLKKFGYELQLVEVKRFKDGSGKADVDSLLTFEAMKYIQNYDRAIFITGDEDYYQLFNYLLDKKEVALLSHKHNTAVNLKRLFGPLFTEIGDLKELLKLQENEDKKMGRTRFSYSSRGLMTRAYQKTVDLSRGKIEFVEIVSLEETGRKEVFDIEVEGTHNFVGNDIIAHNTRLQGLDQLNTSFSLRAQDSTGADKFVVTNAGNVGIGTTGPAQKLDVNGSIATGGTTRIDSSGNLSNIGTYSGSGNISLSGTDRTVSIGDSNSTSGKGTLNIYGYNAADQGAQINLFDTRGTTSASDDRYWSMVNRIGDSNKFEWYYTANNGSTWTSGPVIDTSGSVGIGTAGPTHKLEVTGDGYFSSYLTGGYLIATNFTTDSPGGSMCKRSYDNFVGLCSSLRELKENIAPLGLGLETLLKLQPKIYDWKQPAGSNTIYHDLGFIAEDVEAVNPLLASYDKGKLIGVKYDKMAALLTRAIQEQQGEIASLSGQLNKIALDPNGNVLVDTATGFTYDGHPDNQYSLQDSLGNAITNVASFAQASIANLRAGFIQAENITVKNFSSTLTTSNAVVSNVVKALDATINRIIVTEKIVSPVVETKNITATGTAQLNTIATNEIKPQNQDLTINLEPATNPGSTASVDKGVLARIIIKGLQGKTAAVFDAEGNATLSGTLTAESITASSSSFLSSNIQHLTSNDASVSGTLIAGDVQSENINQLEGNVASQSSNIQNLSSNINDVQKLLADIKNSRLPDTTNSTNLSNTTNLDQQFNNVTMNQLTVSGNSNLYNVSVSGSLLIGQTMIENNSILSFASDLKLSSLSTITLFNGAVVIAKDGTLTTKGTLVAQGGIRTNEIKAINDQDSVNINNLAINNLTIKDKYMDATQSGAVIAASDNFAQNGIYAPSIQTQAQTAGVGILPSNQPEIIIYNDSVKNNSLIYVTPTTINPPQLTVSQKVVGNKSYFVVTTNSTSHQDIQFNWLIIN